MSFLKSIVWEVGKLVVFATARYVDRAVQPSICGYYKKRSREVTRMIASLTDEQINHLDLTEFATKVFSENALPEVALDGDKEIYIVKLSQEAVVSRFGEDHKAQPFVEIHFPVLAHERIGEVINLRTNDVFRTTYWSAHYANGVIAIVTPANEDGVTGHIENFKVQMEARNSEIRQQNEQFTKLVGSLLMERRNNTIASERELSEVSHKLAIPVKKVDLISYSRYAEVHIPEGAAMSVYDVFICHASEDKANFVKPLADELARLSVKVWYDEFELTVGDSLRASIDRGLVNSRFGVVVLSRAFLNKNWPNYELNGLVAKEVQGVKVILPIWHGVSLQDLLAFSPTLADKLALDSSRQSPVDIAAELKKVIDKQR